MDSSSTHSSTTAVRRSSSTTSSKDAVAAAPPPAGAATSSAATASLQLLLREDPLLQQYGLTNSARTSDQVAFQYAATLLQTDSTSSSSRGTSRTAAAQQALQDVERKLALVESLAVKLSRTSPEAVAGPFLRWHGHYVNTSEQQQQQQQANGGGTTSTGTPSSAIAAAATNTTSNNNLASVRDRADRLERQAEVLQGVAKRVEGSLQRGLDRMSTACLRLERVLELSQTLKRLLRFHFEWRKVQNYDLDDTRDLTRAAASVAVLEDLLKHPEWQTSSSNGAAAVKALQHWKPAAEQMARSVRHAAAQLLQQQTNSTTGSRDNPTMSPYHLSATLQVYFSLQELPAAVWQAVDQQHALAESATRELWTPQRLQQFMEQARRGGGSIPSGGGSSKDPRSIAKRLQQVRLEAAENWASVVTVAAMQVQQLQRVLQYKTDPTTRRGFYQVVAASPIPASYMVDDKSTSTTSFSLFGIFWKRYCRTLGKILEQILSTDTAAADALYPAVRGVAKDMVGRFQEVSTSPTATNVEEGVHKTGILGGSLQDWSATANSSTDVSSENPQAAPDSWTRGEKTLSSTTSPSSNGNSSKLLGSAASMAIFQSSEWKDLQGTAKYPHGLYHLQQAFVDACTARLCEPLQYLFPENITLDDNGVPMSGGALSLLPSKYDIQRFDDNIRQELSLADPREGGGDLSSVTMICACVVDMMQQFCHRAQRALSGSNQYITSEWNMTESLQHDRKVAIILYTISNHLKAAPEKTFVAPYRPASLPAHEEAAALCEGALQPALTTIDKMVQNNILGKLAASLNQRLATLLAKMHLGVYLGRSEDESSTFCQRQISPALDTIAESIMTRFPPPFATHLASSVTSFLIYTFCSNVALLRPLSEASRLHITHDLADLELALEQFMSKTAATTLSQVCKGKPYAELRAVRQMLFWNGLSSAGKSGNDLSRMLLRESWIHSLRPSTVLHYLFSYAPTLLTSPHHAQRVKAEEYAQALVSWEGVPEWDGEETAWMNTLACCDSYQQRSGTAAASEDGDARVGALLLALGPELLRRRRN